MRYLYLVLIIFSFLACSQNDTSDQTDKGVSFLDASYEQALTKLQDNDKLLIVDFYSDT